MFSHNKISGSINFPTVWFSVFTLLMLIVAMGKQSPRMLYVNRRHANYKINSCVSGRQMRGFNVPDGPSSCDPLHTFFSALDCLTSMARGEELMVARYRSTESVYFDWPEQ